MAQTPDAQTPALRNTRLVRLLLLSAMGAGLLGLSQTGAAADRGGLVRVSSAASVITLPDTRADEVPSLRASRSGGARTALTAKKTRTRTRISAIRWYRPSPAPIVSPYGMRWGRMHKGIDFGASYGAPIRAVGAGVVIGAGYLGDESGYGQITIIRHVGGVYSAYAHQSRMTVHAGERVEAGQVIGFVGSTGHSTGAHLHFEIRMAPHGGQVNPLLWLINHDVRI